jgi:hypothetical protein
VVKLIPNETNLQVQIELLKAVFLTKSSEWIYENEFRILRALEPQNKTDQVDSFGCDIYLYDLPLESIKGIILGCRSNDNDLKKVQELVLGKNIRILKAQIDENLFKINFSECPTSI